jgi:hypothetical protein
VAGVTAFAAGHGRRYLAAVGYNPFRRRVRRRSDILVVAIALLVIAGLVAWALFGG